VLFSCDGFGGYGALRGAIFDDEYADLAFYEAEALLLIYEGFTGLTRPEIEAYFRGKGYAELERDWVGRD
jgi:hypothetical protein